MTEGEAEEDDAALGDPVRSEVTSGIVPSAEVVSGTIGSVRAGSPKGRESGASSNLSAVTNAHPATAETNALASAHAQVSLYTNTRSSLDIPSSSSRSGRNTANAPRSTADATKSVTPTAEVSISIIRPTSYDMATLYFRRMLLPRTLLDSPTPMGLLSAGGAVVPRGLLIVSCIR